jgi:hypothetical protein
VTGLRSFAILLLLSLVTAGAGIALTAWSTEKVRNSAETVADEDPYCIQVPGEGDYRAVRTLADISNLNLHSSSDHHHAVLAVHRIDGTELLHWSKRNQKFMRGALGPPAIYCTPAPHYLAAIDTRIRQESPSSIIQIEGMVLSIPRSFRPTAKSNSHGILFYARSPSFEHLQISPKYRARTSPDQGSAFIEIDFGRTGFLNQRLHKADASYRVENAGFELGLSKQLVWHLPALESPLYRPSVDYFARSPSGQIETLISCDSIAGGDCIHSFYDNDWTYTFHHRKEFLGEWKAMQDRLSTLVKSFVNSGKLMSFKSGLLGSHFVYKLDRPNSSYMDSPTSTRN